LNSVRPVIEAWRKLAGCPDVSHVRMGRTGRAGGPPWGKNFLRWRIRPVARKLAIPDRLVTFQVMRQTLGTDTFCFNSAKKRPEMDTCDW
jgi:hypothetical protein